MSERFVRIGFAFWQFWAIAFSVSLFVYTLLDALNFVAGCFVGFWLTGAIILGAEHYFEWGLKKLEEKRVFPEKVVK